MRFEIYKDRAGEYRWRLLARNGKKVGDSAEGYKRKRSVISQVHKIIDGVQPSKVVTADVTHKRQ